MARDAQHPVLRFIRSLAARGDGASPNAVLLERVALNRDADAFAELVRRHGTMVWGVCRRVLARPRELQSAEDAFQATFLVLLRKAGSVSRPELLGNWLFGVALRTAQKARARTRHHDALDSAGDLAAPGDPAADASRRDLWRVLDEELARLPEKYRAPVVLCYLEGHSQEAAAHVLGCPRETVATRLTRACERLRLRLTRRDVGLPAGALAVVLAQEQLAAGLCTCVVDATIQAATAGPAGRVVSAGALTLAQGVLRSMFFNKCKLAALVGGVTLAGLGVGVLAPGTHSAALSPAAALVATASAAARPARAEEEEPQGEEVTVARMPPVVVQTSPQAGDTKVDAAATTSIRVTFSKRMQDGSWSWSQISNATFPKITGKPSYEGKDRRTCVLPVTLEPGKTYVLWLNSERFQNFKDADGRPAIPYLLVFQTKPAP